MYKQLSPAQKNTIKKLCNAQDVENVQAAIDNVMDIITTQLLPYFSDVKKQAHAFTTSYMCQLAVNAGNYSVADFMAELATEKATNYKELNDKGAIGDLVEILVRLCLVKAELRRSCHLHVKQQGKTDIISKRFGAIEVGHNGKTWSQGDLFDYMAGDYEAVIYGMLDDYDTKRIVEQCEQKQYEQAIKYVAVNFGYWENKYEYQEFMNNLSRGKGITFKSGDIQTVYNDSKYNAFQKAIENQKIRLLEEII